MNKFNLNKLSVTELNSIETTNTNGGYCPGEARLVWKLCSQLLDSINEYMNDEKNAITLDILER